MQAAATITTGDNLDEEDWFRVDESKQRGTHLRKASFRLARHICMHLSDWAQEDRSSIGAQDQVQLLGSDMRDCNRLSASRGPQLNPSLVSCKLRAKRERSKREIVLGFENAEKGATMIGQATRRHKEEEKERGKSILETGVRQKVQLARLIKSSSFKLSTSRRNRLLAGSMWPTWRQLVLLSFLTILLTSLLANLNLGQSSPAHSQSSSSCLIFNQCHALSVSTQTSAPGTRLTSASTSSPLSATPTSSARPRTPPTGSTTALTTTSMGAPTAPPAATQSSAASQIDAFIGSKQSAKSKLNDQQAINGIDKLPSSSKSSAGNNKISLSSQWSNQLSAQQQRHRFEARLTQLNNPNKTIESDGQQRFDGGNNNGQHFSLNNNYQPKSGGGESDNESFRSADNNGNPLSPGQSNELRSSSITGASEPSAPSIGVGRSEPEAATSSAPPIPAASQSSASTSTSSYTPTTSPVPTTSSSDAASSSSGGPTNEKRRQQVKQQVNSSLELNRPPLPEGWTIASGFASEPTRLQSSIARPQTSDAQVRALDASELEAIRSRLLVSAGLAMPQSLLQNMVRDAIGELMSPGEQVVGAASATRPLVMQPRAQVLVQPAVGVISGRRQKQQASAKSMAASASAPSISLPPLSHFLSPRNPFRLFSSSSTPIATRYRPSFIKSAKSAHASNGNNKPHSSARGWSLMLPSQLQATRTPSPAGHAHARGPPAGFQGVSSLSGLDEAGPSLYAHLHSAEQLERLVRAASQASTGLQSPILPAIVSAPSGPFPGFYIPALESESESQVNELRHGEPASISSKIPGTDYILHPEEVRAMINIGELAWRQQQASDQRQNIGNQQAASSSSQLISKEQQQQQYPGNQQAESNEAQNWQQLNPRQQASGFMRENHAQNLRDFAFVDPLQNNRRDQLQDSASQQNQRQNGINSSELESHLANHFRQKQLSSFPAIIRVNDQDYVHWPLIRLRNELSHQLSQQNEQTNQLRQANQQVEESRKFLANLSPFSSPGLYQTPFNQRGHLFAIASSPTQFASPFAYPKQRVEAMRPLEAAQSQLEGAAAPNANRNQHFELEHSPVRLATQLTAQEVHQVEESIMEALLARQPARNQRALVQSAATQSHAYMRPPANAGPPQRPAGRFPNGLFSLRRRRHSTASERPRSALDTPLLTGTISGPPSLETSSALLFESKTNPQSVLLADQETNKPRRMQPMLAEQTAIRATILMPPQNSHKLAYGNRVAPSRPKPALHEREPSPTTRSAPSEATPKAAMPRANNAHRDVDWPAMVSDADYFPASNGNGRKPHPQVSAESRQVGNGLRPLTPSQSQHRKHHVTSQLKLQFAQDYQAREGVPIYNNNVRVAGALDKQRHLAASSEARRVPSHSTNSSPDETDDSEEADESDDEQPNELQQRGSTTSQAIKPPKG